MGLPTLFIVISSLMQLASIWINGPDGHSLGGWFCLFAGLMMITARSKRQEDDPAFLSFFFQTIIVGCIIMSIIYLEWPDGFIS